MLTGGWGAAAIVLLLGLSPRDEHNEAAENLSKLHFFYEGRGMTLSPDFVNTYSLLARWLNLSKPIEAEPNAQKRALLPFTKRWGMIEYDGEIKGFFSISYKEMQIGALGCSACHSGKAAGFYIPGLGNKNIDTAQVGHDTFRALQLWKSLHFWKRKSEDYKQMEDRAIDFATRLKSSTHSNLTQGLVPVAIIQEWFYRQAGLQLPSHQGRGAVKVPHFWGYEPKRRLGQFSDGFGDGNFPGWGLLVELVGGQSVEGARALMNKVEGVEESIGHLLSPAYPFEVDAGLASRGKSVFEAHCAGCHGTYERDSNKNSIFKAPRHIPWTVVRTDPDRLDIITPEFLKLVEENPLHDSIKVHRREPGYIAPRLDGIWARFPYLHNASVPTVRDLLSHPDDRPHIWALEKAGERDAFDTLALGLRVPSAFTKESKDLQRRAELGDRSVYDIRRPGQSNQGHWFSFSEALKAEEKDELIEYLKTL